MAKIFLYNTLSRQKEEFKPITTSQVGLYTCGPTVYNFAHLGNLRSFLFEDFLKRVLEYNGLLVTHVMNITDVGHLTGDMDMGEDKLEVGAKREGKSAFEVARYFEEAFKKDLERLNIEFPSIFCRATDNIDVQIEMIKTLEEKGYAYQTTDGLYFNTAKFPEYNKLSHLPLEDLKEGARVEKNPEKINPTDFALWKFSPTGSQRQMEWPSPWGVGFPGWHIECSAMSLKYLGKNLDIHCGGIDHINIHHTNEIAQSEAATGQKFFNFWLHGAFLNIRGGKKMAKSGDNFLTVESLIERGISPLAYRFSALQVHYRKPMEYSEEGIKQAAEGLNSLLSQVANLGEEVGVVNESFREQFLGAINDDLNLPQALAVLFTVLKSPLGAPEKLGTILDFDKVLGLKLAASRETVSSEVLLSSLPGEVQALITARQKARKDKSWEESDRLREEIKQCGYLVEDIKTGVRIMKL